MILGCLLVVVFASDHQQSATAVLRPAGQKLPILLRQGEDRQYPSVTEKSTRSREERASFCLIWGFFLLVLAVRADEQHPAHESPSGEDVRVHGSKAGQ